MNYLKTKFAKILVVLLSVCMLVGGAIVTVDAKVKVKESNASEYVATNEHDVMLEVQKGSSWMQSNGENVQVKSIKNKKYFDICDNVQKKFEAESIYRVECMNMIKVNDFDVIANGESFGDKKLINKYRKHFREVVYTSIEKSRLFSLAAAMRALVTS